MIAGFRAQGPEGPEGPKGSKGAPGDLGETGVEHSIINVDFQCIEPIY
jgi:hypothetical protein